MAKDSAGIAAQVKLEIAARKLDVAESTLRDALTLDPNSAELHEQHGLLAHAKGDTSGSLAALDAAVSLAPRNADIRFTQLRIAFDANQRAILSDVAVAAAELAPQDARVLRLAARALMRTRDFARAGAIWRRIGEVTGELAATVEAARVFIAARAFADALDCAEEAIRRDPASLAAKVQKLRAIERTAPESEAFAQALLDIAAEDAWEALEYLPYLLCYGLHDTLAVLLDACSREGIEIDPVLVPPIVRAIEASARTHPPTGPVDASRRRAMMAYLDGCRHSPAGSDAQRAGRNAGVEVGG